MQLATALNYPYWLIVFFLFCKVDFILLCPCFLFEQPALAVFTVWTHSFCTQSIPPSQFGITHCSGNLYNLYIEPNGIQASFEFSLL